MALVTPRIADTQGQGVENSVTVLSHKQRRSSDGSPVRRSRCLRRVHRRCPRCLRGARTEEPTHGGRTRPVRDRRSIPAVPCPWAPRSRGRARALADGRRGRLVLRHRDCLLSGSLYLLAFGGPRWLGTITPLG